MTDTGYADAVLQLLTGPLQLDLPPSICDSLRSLFDEAARSWPDVKVSPARFAEHVAPLIAESIESCSALKLGDLYLVCGCLAGSTPAIAHVQREFLAKVPHMLRSYPSSTIEDVMALLPEKLLVGPLPKLKQYRGRARLVGWLKTVAHRAARDLTRKQRMDDQGCGPDELDKIDGQDLARALAVDAEQEYTRHVSRAEFCRAVTEAVERLPVGQRTLLRGLHVERLTLKELGRPTGADPPAMYRALQQIYVSLRKHIRDILRERLELTATQCDSIVRTMFSQADLRISQLLKA